MKVYISGPFSDKGKIRLFVDMVREIGHTVTWDWTREISQEVSHDEYMTGSRRVLDAIGEADIVIFIFDKPKNPNRGMFTELGISLGQSKKIMIYNPNEVRTNLRWLTSENIETCLYYHSAEVYNSWSDISESLSSMV